ncbi:MAG: hypothetical protein CSA42_08330 [Gammaproteobacteria bacterium]|nr:MAG: hypothetical protein CSA42_08330 [Gammaproteobacteria bacterium]
MNKLLLSLSAVAFLASGCSAVTKADMDALRSDVASAKASADKAYQAAQQANLNAQDAKAMSLKTDEKLNRMFRKAQMK